MELFSLRALDYQSTGPQRQREEFTCTMSSSRKEDYDALEATTSLEDITENEDNQDTLRLLRDNDGDPSRICICEETCDSGEYNLGSSEEPMRGAAGQRPEPTGWVTIFQSVVMMANFEFEKINRL